MAVPEIPGTRGLRIELPARGGYIHRGTLFIGNSKDYPCK